MRRIEVIIIFGKSFLLLEIRPDAKPNYFCCVLS